MIDQPTIPVTFSPNALIPQRFFITVPGATRVMVAGDFTGWLDHPIPMRPVGAGLWVVEVRLRPGTYRYRFLVDDQWWEDFDYTLRLPAPNGSPDWMRFKEQAV